MTIVADQPAGQKTAAAESPVPVETNCPKFSWCQEDHGDSRRGNHFHMWHDRRTPGVAILRTDYFVDEIEDGVLTLSTQESIDWNIPASQVPAFFKDLREEIDRIEAEAAVFIASAAHLGGGL